MDCLETRSAYCFVPSEADAHFFLILYSENGVCGPLRIAVTDVVEVEIGRLWSRRLEWFVKKEEGKEQGKMKEHFVHESGSGKNLARKKLNEVREGGQLPSLIHSRLDVLKSKGQTAGTFVAREGERSVSCTV